MPTKTMNRPKGATRARMRGSTADFLSAREEEDSERIGDFTLGKMDEGFYGNYCTKRSATIRKQKSYHIGKQCNE